jgi:hypothetical protein
MTYAHKVTRVTIMGTMYNTAEIWNTGFFVGTETADVTPPTQAAADMVKTAWQTFFTATGNSINYQFKTTGVKLALVNTDGHDDLAHIVTSMYTSPIAGAETGSGHPPQIALVASLIAGTAKGVGHRGRMYLPGVAAPMDTTGHITTSYPASIATTLATFFSTVNSSFDSPGTVINASKGGTGFNLAPPINRSITDVNVGNVYDTQRRRRNALVETYSTHTV